MTNTVWGFGCSFTQGAFTMVNDGPDGEKYYMVGGEKVYYDNRLPNYHHLATIQDNLLLQNHRNLGYGGIGNRAILYTLLQNIHNITNGDIVVINFTHPNRGTLLFEDKHKQIGIAQTSRADIDWVYEYLKGSEKRKKQIIAHRIPKFVYELVSNLDENKLQIILDHYFEVEEGLHQQRIEKQSIKQNINNISTLLQSLGVKVFIWDTDIWHTTIQGEQLYSDTLQGYFETIYQWTNKHIKDFHWSPNGNRKAGLFFTWCIQNNHTYMTKELLPQFEQSGMSNDFEYIHYESIQKS